MLTAGILSGTTTGTIVFKFLCLIKKLNNNLPHNYLRVIAATTIVPDSQVSSSIVSRKKPLFNSRTDNFLDFSFIWFTVTDSYIIQCLHQPFIKQSVTQNIFTTFISAFCSWFALLFDLQNSLLQPKPHSSLPPRLQPHRPFLQPAGDGPVLCAPVRHDSILGTLSWTLSWGQSLSFTEKFVI